MSTEVYVFADWQEFAEPTLVGSLRSSIIKSKEHFSFNYDDAWLNSPFAQKIDPDLSLYSLNYDLTMEVIDFFRLSKSQAQQIKDEVSASVSLWEKVATSMKIGRQELQLMETAFRI